MKSTKSYSEAKDDQNRLSGALGAALDAIAVAHDLDMTMTKDQSSAEGNTFKKFTIFTDSQIGVNRLKTVSSISLFALTLKNSLGAHCTCKF